MDEIGIGILTVREAAKELRCSYSNVLQMIHSGKLQGKLIGGRYITTVDAIKNMLATPDVAPAPVVVRPRVATVSKGVDLRRKRTAT